MRQERDERENSKCLSYGHNVLTSSLEEYLVVLQKTGRSVLIYEKFQIILSRLYFILGTNSLPLSI